MSNPEKVLFITGGTGHTGSKAVARFAADGWRVRCLVKTRARASYIPKDSSIEIVSGSLDAIDAIVEQARGASAFLNFAHVGFGKPVVELCLRAGITRLISLSSTRRFTQFPESSAQRVISGEDAIASSALDYTILRPSMIYGGARDNNIERMVAWFRKRSWMPLVRGGRNLVQPIFVDDLVEAIARAPDRPTQTGRRSLTVAGPEAITWKEMVETVASEMGKRVNWIPAPYSAALFAAWLASLKPGRPLATPDQVRRLLEDKAFDITEAREALGGWQPRSFREGVRLKLTGKCC